MVSSKPCFLFASIDRTSCILHISSFTELMVTNSGLGCKIQFCNTLQPLYNTVHYNMVLDITMFKDGSQKCIDYIEK